MQLLTGRSERNRELPNVKYLENEKSCLDEAFFIIFSVFSFSEKSKIAGSKKALEPLLHTKKNYSHNSN